MENSGFLMKRCIRLLVRVLKSPAAIIYILCLVLIIFNLVETYRLRPFNSDDVFWQVILQTWHPFNGHTITLGNSSVYVDKIPFYVLFGHFFDPSRRVLFVEAAISTLAGFSLFYASCIYFLKKAKARLSYTTLLPFVWLASFGYSFIQLYLNSDWRGFELGVSFATFAIVAAIYAGDIKLTSRLSKAVLVPASAYAGLQIYSDPYFLYFSVGPLIIFTGILFGLKKIKKRQLLIIGMATVLSLFFAKIVSLISAKAGIQTSTNYPMQFIAFDKLASSFGDSVHSMLIIFGADFFGHTVVSLITAAALLNFLLLCFILHKASRSFMDALQGMQRLAMDKLWVLFFVILSMLVFVAYTFSTLAAGTATYRYFLMLLLIFILLFSVTIGLVKTRRWRYVLSAIVVVAIVLNLGLTAFSNNDEQQPDVVNNRTNSLNFNIIDTLRAEKVSKGYADYWQGSINTYLSNHSVVSLPTICSGGKTILFHWLIDNSTFYQPASRTFYIIDPTVASSSIDCEPSDIYAQFGVPAKAIQVGQATVLIYNYDIGSKM